MPDSIERGTSRTRFEIGFNDKLASIEHEGELPDMFRGDIPLVLEGHWQGGVFRSDRMIVKHSEVYQAANPDRVKSYTGPSSPSSAP